MGRELYIVRPLSLYFVRLNCVFKVNNYKFVPLQTLYMRKLCLRLDNLCLSGATRDFEKFFYERLDPLEILSVK